MKNLRRSCLLALIRDCWVEPNGWEKKVEEKSKILLMAEIRLTTWDGAGNPINNGISTTNLNWFAGFQPSTVVPFPGTNIFAPGN